MNSSFSVEEDGSSSIFDDDFRDEYDELEGADATGSVSSSSSVVLVLPDDGVSVDESEGERTTDQYVPFVVGSVPLYLTAGDDGKPIYIRQVPQGSQTTTNTSGHDLSFGGFSDNSGSTFEGFGSGMFEGFMEDTCDSDESQFDGFSEDSAEIVEGKQKIEYIRKWQKMSQSYNNLDLDSFLKDSNNGFSEAQPSTSKGGRKKPKVAQSSSRPTGYISPGKRKRLSSPDKQNQERLGKASVGNDTSSGSATAEGKRKHRRVSSPKEKPKNVKSSGPSKNEKTELFYLVPDSDVKDEIEIKEEEEQTNNNEFIGVHCNQIGCTISWLESMSTKFVTVTNGIVFELDEFAKRINWGRVDVVKWILRLRGILNIEPSEDDLDKIHVALKRRKALTVTLAGNKRGHLKLQEFDTSEFTLPSDIKKEIEEVIIPEAIVVNLDDVEVNKRSLPLNVGNAGQSSDAHDHLVVPANVGPVHYINENVYEEGEIRKSGRAQKPSARIRDRDGNLAPHDEITSSVVLTMRGVSSDSCRRSLPIGSEMRRASEDAKKFSKFKGNLKKRRVSEDSRLMSAKASTVSKSSENRTGVGDVELEEGEVPNNDLQSLNKTRDSRVSYYCRENRVYPYFNETNECLGKYCTAAGLTVGDLNSLGGKDLHITQGLVTELHRFYRDRGCTITALAQRLLQFKELNSVNLVSMIVKISNLMKKGKKDQNSLNAEFIFPRSKKDDGSSKEKFQAPGWEIKVKQGIPTQASEVQESRRSSVEKIGNSDVGTDVVVNSKKPEKKMTDESTLRADVDKGEGILNDRSQRKPIRRSSRLSFEDYPDEAVLASNDHSKINEKRAHGSVITSDDQRSNKSSEYREEEFDNDKQLKETNLKAVEGKSENEKLPRKLSLQRLKRKPGSQKSNSKSFEKGPKGEERQEEKSVTKIGESSIDGEMETVDKQGPEEQFQRERDGVFESRQVKKKPKLQKRKAEVNVSSADSLKGKETSENRSQKGDIDVMEESKTDKEVEKDEDHLPPGLLKEREVGHKSAKEGGEGKPKMQKSDSKLNNKNGDDADMESDNDNESVGGGSDVGGGVDVGLSCESDDKGCEIGSGNREAKDGKDSAQLDSQTEGTSTAFDVLLGKGKSVENKVECTTPKHIVEKSEDYDKDGSENLGNEEVCVKAKPDVENKSDADTKPEKGKCSIPEDTLSGKDDDEAMKKDNSISKKDSNGNDEMENEKKLCRGNDKDVTLIAGQQKSESIGINDTGTAKQNDVPAGNLNMKTSDGIERGQVSSPKDKSAEIRRGERERTLSKRVQEFHSVSDFFDDYTLEPKLEPKTPKVVDSHDDICGKPVPKKRSGNGLAKQFLSRTDPRVSFSFIDGRIIPYFKEKDFYLGSYCESVGMTVDILNSREPKDIFLTRGVIVELVHFYKSRSCTMTSLADRLLRMKKIYLASILNLVARFVPNMKYEGNRKKLIEEFVFPPGEMNVVKRTPNRKNPKTKNKEGSGLVNTGIKSKKKSKSKKKTPSSTYTCEVVFTDGTTKSKKKKKKKEHGTDVIGVKKLSDMKKGNPKSSGAGVGKIPDQFIVDKEVENARGKEGSVTRADIVLLYAKWLKNKNKIGSSVFVTDLLQDVVKLMEERKVQTIRIPAGTLMSSSVKLYEEYRRMWHTSKADAMMYLEEDWLEDIQYLVSITQTSRRSTVEGNEVDGNAPNADEINTGPRPLHDEGNFSDVSSERSLRIDESYLSDGSDLSDFVDSKISDVKRKKENLSKIKPAPKRKKKSEADNKKLNTKSPSSVNTKVSPAVSKERGFEIEKIVDYKCKLDNNMKKQVSYLVRWKGCGPAKDMWMSEEELQCPKTLNKYWSGSTSSQKSHGVLKWQPLTHNPKMDFSEMLNSLETAKDLPGDISDHAVSECLSGDEVNDKENSPHNLSNLKPKVDRGYMTNGELLHLYDCWRQENQKLLSSKKSHSLNIKAFTEKVRKAMLTHGIETVYSDFLLQACFILTLIRKMLSSEEALREFLGKDCMPALESSRTNQENNRKNRGSAKIKVLSTNFCKLKAEVKKARDSTAGNRLRIAVAEDEIENMERSWDRAQGKSGFLGGALRQEINKLGSNLSKLREEENIHLAKEFQHENPEKYEKTCSDILECGVPKNNIDTVMNSVLKVIGRFTDDVQEGKDK